MASSPIAFDLIARDSASAVIARIIEAIQQIPDVKHIQVEDGDED